MTTGDPRSQPYLDPISTRSMGVVKIGTAIDSKRYYPKSVTSAKAPLRVYSVEFPSVEVESTSYGMPDPPRFMSREAVFRHTDECR